MHPCDGVVPLVSGDLASFADVGSPEPGFALLLPEQPRNGTIWTNPVHVVLALRRGEDLVTGVAQLGLAFPVQAVLQVRGHLTHIVLQDATVSASRPRLGLRLENCRVAGARRDQARIHQRVVIGLGVEDLSVHAADR